MQIDINKTLIAKNYYQCVTTSEIKPDYQLIAKGDDILPFITNDVSTTNNDTIISIRSPITIIGTISDDSNSNITITDSINFNNVIVESITLQTLQKTIDELARQALANNKITNTEYTNLNIHKLKNYSNYYDLSTS